MIKVDLITGFLGSGKTTFLKKYVRWLLENNIKVGILENDYGAVNVDVMLLDELEKMGCIIESVAGACDRDCHQRRFKTKLIALAMCGCERVVIEPSGLFDTDEFFDSLREDPLDRWYETGNVIAVVDAGLEDDLSGLSEYILASECVNAGKIIVSKTQLYSDEKTENTISHIERSLNNCGCKREIKNSIITKNWDELGEEDMTEISRSGIYKADFVKKYRDTEGFSSLYFMNTGLNTKEVSEKADILLHSKEYGNVFRVKGFANEEGKWYEINAAYSGSDIIPSAVGQEIVIVIGENLNKNKINDLMGGKNNG